MKLFAPLFAALSILVAAAPAFACAVCFDASAETQGAFLGTTIFLSLLPLGLMGAFAYWLWRRVRAMDENQPSAG